MSDPIWLRLVKADLGVLEVPGGGANPKIMKMYADVGHAWVKDDVVPWCAALAGSKLKRAGMPYLKTLRARDYTEYGIGASLETAIPGDVVVFSRGVNPAFGHVAFYLRTVNSQVEVIGGNQSNAVTVARYPRSRVIAVRRPIAQLKPVPAMVAGSAQPPLDREAQPGVMKMSDYDDTGSLKHSTKSNLKSIGGWSAFVAAVGTMFDYWTGWLSSLFN